MKGSYISWNKIFSYGAISYNESVVQHIMRQTLFIIFWQLFFITGTKVST